MKKKVVYPSQIRYRMNNPAVSFRLKIEDKIKLDANIEATDKPLSQWMTDFIHKKMAPYEEPAKLLEKMKLLEIKIKELETRIKELENEEKFILPCSICGKSMTISSKRAYWKTKISPKLKETFKRHHIKCESSKSPSPINTINSKEDSKTQ